ncbi:MAG: hypothetical protein JW841_10470 [Deltaproteobacteria bacterium]|nr:hypothetical protein [Deltaproteobacteria bacterium]
MRFIFIFMLFAIPLPLLAQVMPYSGGMAELPFKRKDIWVAPDRLFSIEMPSTWTAIAYDKKHDVTVLKPTNESVDANLVIQRLVVPAGASPRQLLLNAIEQRLSKLPSFQKIADRDVIVSGSPAAIVSGKYYYQGNAQFPRIIEELHIVKGTEAFILHFECYAELAGYLGPDLEGFYNSFTIRPSNNRVKSNRHQLFPQELDTDQIPF